MSCSKCGKCIDKCPKQAIHFHIKGMDVKAGANISRIIFLYAAYLFLLFFCSGYALDLDGNGIDELQVEIDTETGATDLRVCQSKAYTLRNSAMAGGKWILRVGMPNIVCNSSDCASCPMRK